MPTATSIFVRVYEYCTATAVSNSSTQLQLVAVLIEMGVATVQTLKKRGYIRETPLKLAYSPMAILHMKYFEFSTVTSM